MKKSSATVLLVLLLLVTAVATAQPLFDTPALYPINGGYGKPCTGDFDRDGDVDLAITNSIGTVTVAKNAGDGTFPGRSYDYGTSCYPSAITTGQFSKDYGDPYADLVTFSQMGGVMSVLQGGASGHFKCPIIETVADVPMGALTADVNTDGYDDIVIPDMHYKVVVLLGVGDLTFQPPIDIATPGMACALGPADFNGDGHLDLAVAQADNADVVILTGDGTGSFSVATTIAAVAGWVIGIAPVDFDYDGNVDLAVPNEAGNCVKILFGNGDATFQAPVSYSLSNMPQDLIAADFDGDGHCDIVTSSSAGNNISLLRGVGDGTFAAAEDFPVSYRPFDLVCADLDGDDDLDLATVLGDAADSIAIIINLSDQIVTSCDISGNVTYGTSGMNGVTVTLYDDFSTVIASMPTDETGHYAFAELDPGNYIVGVLTPMGFETAQENQTVEAVSGSYTVDFQMTELPLVSAQRTRGYWAHQVNAHLTGLGTTHESYEDMCTYLEMIRTHFNLNLTNPVLVLAVPEAPDCNLRLEVLREVIAPKVSPTYNEVARAHLTALLLNIASFKLSQAAQVSEDGASASQAVTYCNYLVNEGNLTADFLAQEIAETINKGKMVAEGKIDLSTPDIMYRFGDSDLLPDDCSLGQNYPNPFNLSTTIDYSLSVPSQVSLKVYNIAGQTVRTLVDEAMPAGNHTVTWDGTNNDGTIIASGIYFYQLRTEQFTGAKKMLLVK